MYVSSVTRYRGGERRAERLFQTACFSEQFQINTTEKHNCSGGCDRENLTDMEYENTSSVTD